ncbi:MAG TPA: oxidative damage protection protein [Labilithrix sp.]|nr:oxidative damage protection protein [Labilithrix sp.]
MSETRMVKCRKLGKELPGLTRQPYKNELGKRLYEEVSQEAWNMWLKDSVKFINTYRLDLTSAEGQKFMFDQCEVYFGMKEGKLADTAFVPAEGPPSAASAKAADEK